MEEFFPGLVKMMEERFGIFGRYLGNLTILAIAFGAVAWGVVQVNEKILTPIFNATQRVYGEDLILAIVVRVASFVIGIGFIWLIGAWLLRRHTKHIVEEHEELNAAWRRFNVASKEREDELKADWETLNAHLDAHLQAHQHPHE